MTGAQMGGRKPAPDDVVVPRSAATQAIAAVAVAFGADPMAMVAPSRPGWRGPVRLSIARHIAMGMTHATPHGDGRQRTYPEVARYFSGRDHTTIIYAVRRYRRWCEAAGLDLAPGDFADHARRLAEHLDMAVPPAPPEPLSLHQDDQDDGDAPMPETIPPEPAGAATPEPVYGEPDLGLFRMSLEDWLALPAAEQSDGARLAVERSGSIEAAAMATGLPQAMLARAYGLTVQPHDLPRIVESRWTPADEPPPRSSYAPPGAASSDGGFMAFAQIHLVAGASLVVPDAYATYQAFCRARRDAAIPRSSFGAALLELARQHGGARTGDVLSGIALRNGSVARVHRDDLARSAPKAKPPRAPLALGVEAMRRAGHKVIEVGLDGSQFVRRALP